MAFSQLFRGTATKTYRAALYVLADSGHWLAADKMSVHDEEAVANIAKECRACGLSDAIKYETFGDYGKHTQDRSQVPPDAGLGPSP